jgi:hypothetical protein
MHDRVDSSQRGLRLRSITHISVDEFKTGMRPHTQQRFATMHENIQHPDAMSFGQKKRNQSRSHVTCATSD